MSFLARLSLRNRGLVALIAIIILGFGAIAIPSLKQQLLPSLSFPAAFVVAPYPGAAPDIVEEQVTKPIEDALQGVADLEDITSTSAEGSATITVTFAFGTPIDDITNKIQTAVNRIGPQLPEGVDPQVVAGSTDDLPAIVLAATKSGDQSAFAAQLTSVVMPALQGVEGVRTVEVTGVQDQNVVITLDPARAAPAGVTAETLTAALRANGVSIPAGTVIDGDRALSVQVGGALAGLDDLRNLAVTPAATLGSVATVELTPEAQTSVTRTNGKPSFGIQVTASPDGNAVQISNEIRDKLAGLEKELGGDAALVPIFDQAPSVEESISSLTTEGALGLVFAVLVILVFLLSVRSTLVTAVSIPMSVVVALIALWVGDYSLNILTLGALTIAVGRVVDDSIVVLENIKRHLGYGEEKQHAILTGVREVTGAVVASTLTTVAVFAPIALVSGFVGELFRPFAVTVAVALLASLVVSLTVVPVLSYWFLRPPKTGGRTQEEVEAEALEKERRSPLQRAYLPVIRFATRRRLATVALGLVVFVLTLFGATFLKTNFLDDGGQREFTIAQELPVGSNLAATDAAARKIEDILAGHDEVEAYQVTIGSSAGQGWGGAQTTNTANFQVTATEDADVERLQADLRTETGALTGAGTITVGSAAGGPGGSTDSLQVVVQANRAEDLTAAAKLVQDAMTGTPGIADVESNLAASVPRVDVKVRRDVASRYGLSDAAVGQIVAGAYRGQTLTRLTVDGQQRDVVLRFGAPPASIEELKALPLPVPGGPVRLDAVAEVAESAGPLQITRIDGERSAAVSGRATGSDVGATSTDLQKRLDDLVLPAGATVTLGGVSADQAEAFSQLGLAMLVAIAIVFIIMVATFRSIVQPLILLVSIPFAATGAIALLLLTDTALGVPALIGVLMLIGIVVTNAIVLMDLINQYREQGMSVRDAVVEGGRRRLRPILMTAVATICALLPMALGVTGEGGFISQPLAVVVIGGLISSTLLTLVLVPTLYTMVEGRRERRRERKRAAAPAEVEAEVEAEGERPVGAHRLEDLQSADR
ncbi:efflux RND transporter permease subunit [Virgisporangium ochraceum]|uniref:Hydrogenase expression protein n=1 Tax=Virgisporangium ochraceum TaxID=65505 RepID=A0A8J4A4D1_9ACTN|nr:hydrogenase expression protein [Virgisporangium ochraceum]